LVSVLLENGVFAEKSYEGMKSVTKFKFLHIGFAAIQHTITGLITYSKPLLESKDPSLKKSAKVARRVLRTAVDQLLLKSVNFRYTLAKNV